MINKKRTSSNYETEHLGNCVGEVSNSNKAGIGDVVAGTLETPLVVCDAGYAGPGSSTPFVLHAHDISQKPKLCSVWGRYVQSGRSIQLSDGVLWYVLAC